MKQFRKRVNWFISSGLCVMLIYVLHLLTNKESCKQANDNREKSTNMISESSEPDKVYYQTIPECACSRKFKYPPPAGRSSSKTGNSFAASKRFNSSCSDQGTFYQKNQNVVAFSLHLGSDLYLNTLYDNGIMHNLQMMRKYYPGYSLRLYTDVLPTYHRCAMLCTNEDLFWCYITKTPSHGDMSGMVFRTWRFLPLGDPTVDVFLSRDLDSLISAREAAVVLDWLSHGDKAISLMRDSTEGHDRAVLAGMWQASNNMLGIKRAAHLRDEIIKLSRLPSAQRVKSSDQGILKMAVFERERGSIVAYDSYNCVKWANYTLIRPYPIQRGEPGLDFVGNRVDFGWTNKRKKYPAIECPLECRPIYGQNWTYC